MLTILSPAKTLDFGESSTTLSHSQPEFIGEAKNLIDIMRSYTPEKLNTLMRISDKLAQLNYERYLEWQPSHMLGSAKQALLAFRGDVYQGLNVNDWTTEDFNYAQDHLRILSGLYGVLRPLDLIYPYRLEMGSRVANARGKNLYAYWQDIIAPHLDLIMDDGVLINLASQEYFSAVNVTTQNWDIYTPIFKDYRQGAYKIISFYAKRARGAMSAWIINNKINNPKQLVEFEWQGYAFSSELSKPLMPMFVRTEA